MILQKDEMVQFILRRKYFLKQYKITQSKWRKKIGVELVKIHGVGNADLFCEVWKYLEEEKLI